MHALRSESYSIGHSLVASLPVREFVTTNYDRLLEIAAQTAGDPLAVIPYDPVMGDSRWLLKLHGCIDHPDDIVLTREHYLRYSERRAALAGIVQAMLITRHMLFLGFSLNDDNFHRIVDDVRRLVRIPDPSEDSGSSEDPIFGTATTITESTSLAQLWDGDLDILSFGGASGTPGTIAEAARLVEIFLDRILLAATDRHEYLLNPDHQSALDEDELALAERLRPLVDLGDEILESDLARPVRQLLAHYGLPDPRP
ncbi:MAG: SIR2 family protein [Acidobacteria bacterium]|nr:SIR2 family protein [Acidobacteriota bacterium]